MKSLMSYLNPIIVRMIPRGFAKGSADTLIGFVTTTGFEALKPEALYEIKLFGDGTATWRMVEEKSSLAEEPNGRWRNSNTFDHLYQNGDAGIACFPETEREYQEQKKNST